MRRRAATIFIAVSALGLTLGLAACTGFWQTAVQVPKLIVGPVMVTGTEGYVLVSVADMPDGGIASILFGTIGNEGIQYTNIDGATIAVEGKNGFTVLSPDFTTTPGKGVLIAVNAPTGIVGGEVLRFTFTVTGANPTFDVIEAEVTMADDDNHWITVWDLETAPEYHTR
jgi:hypothetical protein